MSNDLKSRFDRIQDTWTPQPPPGMIGFIVRFSAPVETPAAGKRAMHRIGRDAECAFFGGTPKEQRGALKWLRKSDAYDQGPTFAQPMVDGKAKANVKSVEGGS